MDALFLMKCIVFGAFFIGGVLGVALGALGNEILDRL